MSKTLGTKVDLLTAQEITTASGEWVQSSSYVDVSGITGYISVTFKVKGDGTDALTADVTLKARPSIDGTTFCDADEGIPLAVINSAAASTYETEVVAFDVTPYDELAFSITNGDTATSAYVSLSYRTSSV